MANRIREKYMARKKYFDYPLLFLVIFLVLFGMVMIFSTSSYKSTMNYGNPYHWLIRQGIAAAIGVVGMIVFCKLDYRLFRHLFVARTCYWLSIILLGAVLIIGAARKGSMRWISIGGFQFQPSEFAKIFLVIYLAYILSRDAHKMKTFFSAVKVLAKCALIIGLVAYQNLSTALVLCAITGVMIFVVSPKTKQLIGIAVGMVGVLVAYLTFSSSYRNERLQIWLHPESHEKGLQTMQALYAIGSGGIFGKGLGQSMQKMGFIPESHNDMIFSIICEELGLFGAVCLILVFMALIWRILLIAMNAEDLFGSLIAIGFMTHIAVQVFINIAVVTNTIPPTGIPLPFISYGGSSILAILVEMGIVLSISKRIRL
nr:putative lipid II flippase FtsW [uncultured Anaerostipes sp.]